MQGVGCMDEEERQDHDGHRFGSVKNRTAHRIAVWIRMAAVKLDREGGFSARDSSARAFPYTACTTSD